MSNWAFLSCTQERRTFPSYGKTSRSNVAVLSAPSYIPLLWWAIFRPEDLLQDRFAREAAEEGPAIPAPVVARTEVAARLAEATPRVERLFPKGGSLARHADLLLAALEQLAKKTKFVTLEHIEIAAYYKGDEFAAVQQRILSFMEGKSVANLKSLLRPFTVVAGQRRFVLPDEVTKERFSKASKQDLYGLLGAGADKLAPWDKLKPLPPALNSPQAIQEALSDACWNDDLEQARAMLALGASPHKPNKFRNRPLTYAVKRCSLEVTQLLLAAGARPRPEVVCDAAAYGSSEALKLLLDAGGDVNSAAKKTRVWGHQYAVSLAALSDRDGLDKLKLLLERGADVNARNVDGRTCLAEVHEESEALRLMLPSATQATRKNAIAYLNERIEIYGRTKLRKFHRKLQEHLRMVEEYRPASRPGNTKRRKTAKT